jgi:hypothetical protein
LYLKVAIAEVGVDARHFMLTAVVRPLATAAGAVAPLVLSVWLLPDVTLPGALALSMCYAVVFAIIMGGFNMDQVERTFVQQALRRPWRRHLGKHVQHPL